MIVEKTEIDLRNNGLVREFFACAFTNPNKHTTKYSLTFEGYITEWTQNRKEAEAIEKEIEAQQ